MTEARVILAKDNSTARLLSAVYMALIAFLAYSAVYAFRKPFSVATFPGSSFNGISYQTLLIIFQVIGYMLSKFFGIRFISALKSGGRWKSSIFLVGASWLSLLFFALTPAPFGVIFMLFNGFTLGFMWGIIFSYIEGRRATDFVGTVMAISFIFAGGFTRSVGKWLMVEWGVSESWMPFVTGLIFIGPLILLLYLLNRIPPPDKSDVQERTVRLPMTTKDRKKFLKVFGFGIIIVTSTYVFLTMIRDIRDNYMSNIWTELGYGNDYSIFARTETITSLLVLFIMAFLGLIRKNIEAFRVIHIVIGIGFLVAGISSWLFISNYISGALWMQFVGLGLYMSYIPFNCIFFERLIATFRIAGNVGFLIYFADSFGYLGSVLVMISKEFLDLKLNWSQFYSHGVVIAALIGLAGTMASFFYFNKKYSVKNIG